MQSLLVENSLRQVTHRLILALGVAISLAPAGCGIDEARSGSGPAPAAVVASPAPETGSDHGLTDAVIPPRLPGMIGASRPIYLESRSTTLQLVDVLSRDSIPAIDNPTFLSSVEASSHLSGNEFVIGLSIDNEQRAYPTAFLSSYEIVNDVVGDTAVAVTW